MVSMSTALEIGQELASVPFDEMIKNLLLAMVAAQDEANKSFIKGIEDLADTEVEIKYTKTGDGTTEKTISGNALAFGILPTMLQIQQGVIEIKMAITMQKTRELSVATKFKAKFWIFSASVDAKYSSTYSYKVEASSYIRIQVAPAPPPPPIMKAIEVIAADNPPNIPPPTP